MLDWNEMMKGAEAELTLAPPGDHDMIVHSAEAKVYSTGNQGIAAVFMFENGPHAGQKVFNNFVVVADNPKALGFFFRNMKTLGLDSAYFAKNPGLDEIAEAIIGRRVIVKLAHRKYEEQLQYDVKAIKPPNGALTGTVTSSSSTPSVPTMNTPTTSKVTAPSVPNAPIVPSVPKSAPPVPPTI